MLHFEKMLYDQAQLAVSYLDAYQVTKHSLCPACVELVPDLVGQKWVGFVQVTGKSQIDLN